MFEAVISLAKIMIFAVSSGFFSGLVATYILRRRQLKHP